ncbi:MAG TPA: homocitrate synthase [Clostridiaceae bacterium]|nr:homocitrate synthase [Clostridiaceae bacterium]
MLKEIENVKMNGMPYYSDDRWVSPLNFDPETRPETTSKQIYIHDVTLRDGEQTTGLNWTEDERIRIAVALDRLGVQRIEVGMPIVSPDIVKACQDLSQMGLKSELVAFCRARKDDIDYALESQVKHVIVEHAVNPYTNFYGYSVDDQKLLERVISTIDYATSKGLSVTFMGWDVTRAPLDYVLGIYRQVVEKVPVSSVVYTDSFGVATPNAISRVIREMKSSFDCPVEFHLHNEFGMAMGAVTSAIFAGVDGIHSSINGLGERTGNVATEEVIAASELLLNVPTGTDRTYIDEITKLVSDITSIPIPTNKPVTGTKLFWLESGVVVQAKERMEQAGIGAAMSPYLPHLVGREDIKIVVGGSSGKDTMAYFLDKFGIPRKDDFDLAAALQACKDLSREKRRNLTDDEVRAILEAEAAR